MPTDTITQVDSMVRRSLESLAQELLRGDWKGRREREVVSLFCFGHLVQKCAPGSVLHDPSQISIEVAVPQIRGQADLTAKAGNKAQVCKDIVLWPRPRMVAWDDLGRAIVSPMSILEWKHNEGAISEYDVRWLCQFSAERPDFVGYAVCTNLPAKGFTLSCTRVALGQREDRWLHRG
jgi:hypothetical protein